ncbi:MAG: hypothetical protein EOO53_12135 [Gammaproteobacteria bacterium]|nr:MAG: hypothetical protein EOO53_12135 [Gammaproteobacteria bacterium]
MKPKYSFLKRNGLLVVFITLMLLTWAGQAYTGWNESNEERLQKNLSLYSFSEYLHSGHFIQATFENWESEFFQMGLYVFLTVFLFQQGSAESKSLEKAEDVDRNPRVTEEAPWPVKKGGWVLAIYKNSLSLIFMFLFVGSFICHAYGTMEQINEKENKSLTLFEVFTENRFWFESLQNWQSEFLSVAAIVFFSIYLRQHGSPESKPVDAPHDETGK